jgi:hypothetical protein
MKHLLIYSIEEAAITGQEQATGMTPSSEFGTIHIAVIAAKPGILNCRTRHWNIAIGLLLGPQFQA